MNGTINIRRWLNAAESPSTGSVVCYSGPAHWTNKEGVHPHTKFLEISDCNGKIRLHITDDDIERTDKNNDPYMNKIKLLRDTISEFIVRMKIENGEGD